MFEEARRNTSSKWTKPSAGVIGQAVMYDYAAPNASQYPSRVQTDHMYLHPEPMINGTQNGNLSVLTDNMGRMNLQAPSYHVATKPSPAISTQSYDGGVQLNATYPSVTQTFMHNGVMYASPQLQNPTQQHNNMAHAYGMYPHYVPQQHYGYPQHMISGHTPMSSAWPPSTRIPSAEVPSLVTARRGSASSQENDVPGTPFTHYTGYGEYPNSVAVLDRSPHSLYPSAWSTPSPTQTNYKHQPKTSISTRLQMLCQQEPAIPRAVPAPYSPVKPLDRSLENPHGITNVYIRGLLPETTDDFLYKLASRFGDIVSSKSIIEHNTGLCKGFGFVKFHNFKDAEDCIRGFHFLGYESSFARESFYSQLKKLHDDDNTNLYVSNLPKDMNEHELGAIFGENKVCSSRILRDNQGNGRGVGFARFENRTICEEIIKLFNNTPVHSKSGGEEHLIQIRFADTPDQKHLKQQTAAARQYRTAEYESQTTGRTAFATPVHPLGISPTARMIDRDFGNYMDMTTGNRGFGGGNARDRLSTVSSHLNTPQPSVIHVNLPASATISPPEGPVTVKSDAQGAVTHDDSNDHRSASGERGLSGIKVSA